MIEKEKISNEGVHKVIVVEKNAPYQSPTPGEFPIIAESPFAMSVLSDINKLQLSDVEDITECGFNAGMELVAPATLDKILSILSQSKKTFKFLPASPLLHDANYKTYIAKYKNNKCIGGWDFKDEPKFDEFDTVYEQYKKIREADSSHLVFINLLGGKSLKADGKEIEFEDYLNAFQDKFAPGLLSYDLYPIVINGKDELAVRYMPFYRDFQLVSKMAKEKNRPFWAFVESMAFRRTDTNNGCPAPKEEYMRYEAFTALAYGAQGIIYWTYAQRNDPIDNTETYSTALIDKNGNKTPYWYYAQKVNMEIRKFSTIFLGCTFVKYAHMGNLGEEFWDFMPPTSIGGFGPIHQATSIDKGAVCTIIHNEDVDYMYGDFLVMVNHSPLESSRINMIFSKDYDVRDLTNCKEADFSDATKVTSNGIGIVLGPGEYRIYAFA